jgi:hypothetical protein
MRNTKKLIAATSILGLVGMLGVYSVAFASTATVAATVTVQNIALTVADGTVAYGTIPSNTTRSTCSGELNDAQTVTNTGNVSENFLIRGQNSANWTLASTAGSNQYVHKALNGACTTFPGTGTITLTTTNQTLATGIAPNGTATLNLQVNTPNPSTVFTQQSVDATLTATAS